MANAGATQSFSLYDDLTHMQPGAPAAELIHYMIKEIGHDVCESKRNSQTSYRLISRARDAYNYINQHIKGSVKSTDEWESYRTQLELIEQVEDILFDFAPVAEVESASSNDVVVATTNYGVDSFTTWKNSREKLRATLNSPALNITGSPKEWNKDLTVIHKYDDLSWLSNVCDSASSLSSSPTFLESDYSKSDPEWGGPGDTTHTVNILNQLHSTLQVCLTIDEPVILLSIRCAMVLDGALKLAGSQTGEDKTLGLYLTCKMLWDEAQDIVTKLLHHIKSKGGNTNALDVINSEWRTFEEKLKSTPKGYSPQIPGLDSLIKCVELVRRPFHARALALVQQCHLLLGMVRESDDKTAFISAIAASQAALDSAQAMDTGFSALKWADVQSHNATVDFNSAIDQVCSSTESYGEKAKANEVRRAMEAAETRDKDRVALLEQRTSRWKGRQPSKMVSVTVVPSSKKSETKQFLVDPAETVDLILWKHFASNTSDLGLIPQFYTRDPVSQKFQRIRSGTKIKDINTSAVKLYLASKAGEMPKP